MKKELNIQEIKNGYYYDKENKQYVCNFCGRCFEDGEIFSIENRFFENYKAIEMHIKKEHGKVLNSLLDEDKKYTG
ncbi:MAG: transcriptional regulator, partial [Clostridiaceae bacterium]|nr:transcriptional regulator [Clostridiaceae bacterium]